MFSFAFHFVVFISHLISLFDVWMGNSQTHTHTHIFLSPSKTRETTLSALHILPHANEHFSCRHVYFFSGCVAISGFMHSIFMCVASAIVSVLCTDNYTIIYFCLVIFYFSVFVFVFPLIHHSGPIYWPIRTGSMSCDARVFILCLIYRIVMSACLVIC